MRNEESNEETHRVDATLVQFTAQGRAPEYADRVLGPPRSTQTKAGIASTFSRGRSGCPGIGVEKYALRRVGQCPIMAALRLLLEVGITHRHWIVVGEITLAQREPP